MVYFSLHSSGAVPLILLTCIWYLAIRRIWSMRMFELGINPKHAGMEKDCSDNRGTKFKNHAVVSFQNVCVVLHSQKRYSRVSTATLQKVQMLCLISPISYKMSFVAVRL